MTIYSICYDMFPTYEENPTLFLKGEYVVE